MEALVAQQVGSWGCAWGPPVVGRLCAYAARQARCFTMPFSTPQAFSNPQMASAAAAASGTPASAGC